MKFLIGVLGGCFFLLACSSDEEMAPDPEEKRHEALSVLDGALYTPTGKVKATRKEYLGSLSGFTYWHYDKEEKNVLKVSMSQEEDTLGINVFKFDELDRVIEKLYFAYEEGEFTWKSSLKSSFSMDGLREDIYASAPDKEEKYRYSYIYNEDGGLTEWRFDKDGKGEKYVYLYEDGRISEERWVLGDGAVFEYYLYRYRNDGLLEAKETPGTGVERELDDTVQYEYNESGQLIEVRHYDQYFGFDYTGKTEYYYY